MSLGADNNYLGGHSDFGRDFFISAYESYPGIDSVNYGDTGFPSPSKTQILSFTDQNGTYNCGPSASCLAVDLSLRNNDDAIALVSTYTGTNGPYADNANYGYPFANELVLSSTANTGAPGSGNYSSQEFLRFAHIRSDYTISDPLYYRQPHGTIDRQARYVAFTSDVGSSSTYDVYLAKIPHPAQPTVGPYNSGFFRNVPPSYHLDFSGRLWSFNGTAWQLVSGAPSTVLSGGIAYLVGTIGSNGYSAIFMVGENGHLYRYDRGGWTDMGTAGCDSVVGNPSAANDNWTTTYSGILDVSYGCNNNHVVTSYYSSGTWNYRDLGLPPNATTTSSPISDPSEQLASGVSHVYVIASDDKSYRYVNDGSTGWVVNGSGNPTGTSFAGSPAAAYYKAGGNYYAFHADASGNVWLFNAGANTWTSIGHPYGCFVSDLAATSAQYAISYYSYNNNFLLWTYLVGRCNSGDALAYLQGEGPSGYWTNWTTIAATGSPTKPVSRPSLALRYNNAAISSMVIYWEATDGTQYLGEDYEQGPFPGASGLGGKATVASVVP